MTACPPTPSRNTEILQYLEGSLMAAAYGRAQLDPLEFLTFGPEYVFGAGKIAAGYG